MKIKKSLTGLAALAGLSTAITASAPAIATPVSTPCSVNEVWTLPSNTSASQCLGLFADNITSESSGTHSYKTNVDLLAWAPYTSGSWSLTPNALTPGGLWDSGIVLGAGKVIDLIVFLKQGNAWGAYFFDDVDETKGGFDTSEYAGSGTGLSHGFVIAGEPGDKFEVPVPEPTSLLLFGSALTALGLRRRNKNA